jgi:hypothetical protein
LWGFANSNSNTNYHKNRNDPHYNHSSAHLHSFIRWYENSMNDNLSIIHCICPLQHLLAVRIWTVDTKGTWPFLLAGEPFDTVHC